MCVTGAGAGVDSVWEQKKREAGKMLAVGAAESPASSARFVRHRAFLFFLHVEMLHSKSMKFRHAHQWG